METILLLIALTNDFTIVPLPFVPYNDLAYMYCYWDTGDTNPIYGIRLTGVDKNGAAVTSSYVQESYVPPMTEMTSIYLPPYVTELHCLFFGTNLAGKWCNAKLTVVATRPKLTISESGSIIILNWFAPYGGWSLERQYTNKWYPSPAIVPNEGMGIFRLIRNLTNNNVLSVRFNPIVNSTNLLQKK